VRKQRRTQGIYISGITLNERAYNLDVKMGAPLLQEAGGAPIEEETQPLKPSPLLSTGTQYKLGGHFYEDSMSLFKETPLKLEFNKRCKVWDNPPGSVLLAVAESYFSEIKQPTPLFKELVTGQLIKGIKKIVERGAIPFVYKRMGVSPRILPVGYGETINSTKRVVRNKRMGVSPRILPVGYGETINSTKRVVRNECYRYLSKARPDYVIADIDLVSCYTSILLGLLPQETKAIQKAIEGQGL
jgi:hypothetical protein